jgi:hypothetical protein
LLLRSFKLAHDSFHSDGYALERSRRTFHHQKLPQRLQTRGSSLPAVDCFSPVLTFHLFSLQGIVALWNHVLLEARFPSLEHN